MVKHLVTALQGAVAGALIGLAVQLGELGDANDPEQVLRRVVIGGAVWALGAVSLSFVFQRVQGRQGVWALGVAAVLVALCALLAAAGTVALGFATRFAWLQASSLTVVPALGVWLGGALSLRQRPTNPTSAP